MAKSNKNPVKTILIIIIIIAFICGLALGVSVIMGGGSDTSEEGDVQYVNVTKNITKYNDSGDVIQTEDGSYVASSDYVDNVTGGENVTAFNSSNSGNLYWTCFKLFIL